MVKMKWLMIALGLILAACGTVDDPNDNDTDEVVTGDSIVDVAQDEGFTEFVQALNDALGEGEFNSGGPYTLFVPTNAAFDAANLAGEDVLEYHIVEGKYTLDELSDGPLETANGLDIEVSVRGSDVSLNGQANVTEPNDLQASNGVVHAIDSVLTPPESDEGEPEPEDPEPINTSYSADLSIMGAAEGEGTGTASATLDGNTLNVEGSVQNLSSAATQVALYEGGGDDVGRFLYDLSVSGDAFSGNPTLSEEEVEILENGDLYVTVSTESYPEGEISGPLYSAE